MPKRRSPSSRSWIPLQRGARVHYLALVASGQGNRVEAAAYGEKALAAARDAGNIVLQPLVLMGLVITRFPRQPGAIGRLLRTERQAVSVAGG